MDDPENIKELCQLKNLKESQIVAMEAIFALAKAIGPDALTLADLIEVISLAVEDGHNTLMISLEMASQAVCMAGEQRGREGRA